MKIEIEYDENDNQSAFAHGLGKMIEGVIENKIKGTIAKNAALEGMILDYVRKLNGKQLERYKEYFNIKSIKDN